MYRLKRDRINACWMTRVISYGSNLLCECGPICIKVVAKFDWKRRPMGLMPGDSRLNLNSN
jgi:hypothetical protein